MSGEDGLLRDVNMKDGFAGAGIADSVKGWVDSLGTGDVGGIAVNSVGLGLDVLGMVVDPLGSVLSAGVGWLIEHISFLREPLDKLAGDPGNIAKASGEWYKISEAMTNLAKEHNEALARESADWTGQAGDKARASLSKLGGEIEAYGALAKGAGDQIMIAGTMVAVVRGLIRDIVAMFVAEAIKGALIAAASAVPTAGASIAAYASYITGRGAIIGGRIIQKISDLLAGLGKIASRLKQILKMGDDIAEGAGRFARGAAKLDQLAGKPGKWAGPKMADHLNRVKNFDKAYEEGITNALNKLAGGEATTNAIKTGADAGGWTGEYGRYTKPLIETGKEGAKVDEVEEDARKEQNKPG